MRYEYQKLNAEMPSAEDVRALTTSEVLPSLADHLAECGLSCFLDRSDAQQRLCSWGLDGTCCRRCLWGPCRVTDEKPGICGAGPASVVMANHLRIVAAGAAAHGTHAKERLERILAVCEGRAGGGLQGEERALWLAEHLAIPREDEEGRPRSKSEIIGDVARAMYEDLGRPGGGPMRLLEALAPADRREIWENLGLRPTSVMAETFEALHRTGLGAESDWHNSALHELRLAVAFFWGAVVVASFASEILYGRPEVTEGEVGFGTLARGEGVKVALHGHLPVVAEAVRDAAEDPELLREARAAGADGFDLYGICCSGQELFARHGVPAVTGILGQELALATGALDALVADLQCVIPGIVPIAEAKGTRVITTHYANRLHGAVHIPMDIEHPEDGAREILLLALDAYRTRNRSRVRVPAATVRSRSGYDEESILAALGGEEAVLGHLRSGTVRGIVTMVSCNTPKVPYERSNVVLAKELLRRGMLVTTTGCAGHALAGAGLTSPAARAQCPPGLREVLEAADLPPVLPVGACVDNTRTMLLWLRLAAAAELPLSSLPLFYIGAEPGNEKAISMGMAFLAHGIWVLSGFPIPVPVPTSRGVEGGALDDMERVSNPVADFFAGDAQEVLGAGLIVEPDPERAAGAVQMTMRRKRWALGW